MRARAVSSSMAGQSSISMTTPKLGFARQKKQAHGPEKVKWNVAVRDAGVIGEQAVALVQTRRRQVGQQNGVRFARASFISGLAARVSPKDAA